MKMEQHEKIPSKNKWLVYGIICVFASLVLGFLIGQVIAQNQIDNFKKQVDVYKEKMTFLENKINSLNEEITALQSKNTLSLAEQTKLKGLLAEQNKAVLELLNTINTMKTTTTTTYTHSGGGGGGGVS